MCIIAKNDSPEAILACTVFALLRGERQLRRQSSQLRLGCVQSWFCLCSTATPQHHSLRSISLHILGPQALLFPALIAQLRRVKLPKYVLSKRSRFTWSSFPALYVAQTSGGARVVSPGARRAEACNDERRLRGNLREGSVASLGSGRMGARRYFAVW